MIAFLPLFLRFLPYLLAIGSLFALYEYEQHRCNSACESQTERADKVTAEFAAYKEKEAAIVAGLANEWDTKRKQAEATATQLEKERAANFSALQDRARVLATGGGDAGGHLRLYDDARAAAEAAGTPAKPTEASTSAASSTEEYIVALYGWAAVCKERVDAWFSFYQSLRTQ